MPPYPPAWEPWVTAIVCPGFEELLQAGFDTDEATLIICEWRLAHPEEPEG